MTINPDTFPLDWVGCLIVVFTIIQLMWLDIMTINPDTFPLDWVDCLIVVGMKDRRIITIFH